MKCKLYVPWNDVSDILRTAECVYFNPEKEVCENEALAGSECEGMWFVNTEKNEEEKKS